MKTTPTLRFRAYALKELACLYFPDDTAEKASRHLRQLIRHDPALFADLQAHGYRPRQRIIPPLAVQILLQYLGSPEVFYEITRTA